MGKVFKVIGYLFLTIFIAVIVGIIVVFAKVHDKTNDTSAYVLENKTTVSEQINKVLARSMENTNTTQDISLNFTEEDLNYILYSFSQTIDIPVVDIVSAYVKLNSKGIYTITAPVKVFGIASTVNLSLKITELDGTFTIEIVSFKLGTLSLTSKLIKKYVISKFKIEDFEKKLSDKGYYVDIDVKKLTITITKDNILKMIENASSDPNYCLYKLCVDNFLDNSDLLSFSFGTGGKLGFDLHLKDLEYKQEVDGEIPFVHDLSSIETKLETLLDNKVIKISNTNMMFNFLVKGYSALTPEEQNLVSGYNLNSIGISNPNTYQGIITKQTLEMPDVFSNISDMLTLPYEAAVKVKISDTEIAKIIYNSGVVGNGFAFADYNNSQYKVSYFMIDAFYVTVTNNKCELNIVLNFHGEQSIIKASTVGLPQIGSRISLDFDHLYLGTKEVSSESRTNLLKFLEKALSEESWFSVSSSTQKITFDFAGIITDNEVLKNLVASSHPSVKTSLNDPSGTNPEGYIEVAFSTIITLP